MGVCIIAASVYFFYISLAKKNSPELFYLPEVVQPRDYPCSTAVIKNFTLCIPAGISVSESQDGLELSSAPEKIRGTVRLMDELPQDEPWRTSLHKPLIKTFLGDVEGMDTFDLMLRILEHRYNPALMGVKAKLIPPWMKNSEQAQILIPEGSRALLFYTHSQFMGLIFSGRQVIMLTVEGYLDEGIAAGIMDSLGST